MRAVTRPSAGSAGSAGNGGGLGPAGQGQLEAGLRGGRLVFLSKHLLCPGTVLGTLQGHFISFLQLPSEAGAIALSFYRGGNGHTERPASSLLPPHSLAQRSWDPRQPASSLPLGCVLPGPAPVLEKEAVPGPAPCLAPPHSWPRPASGPAPVPTLTVLQLLLLGRKGLRADLQRPRGPLLHLQGLGKVAPDPKAESGAGGRRGPETW